MSDDKEHDAEEIDHAPDDAPDEVEMGLLAEFWDFLKHNKKWWILPLVIVVIIMAILIAMNNPVTRPFIYQI